MGRLQSWRKSNSNKRLNVESLEDRRMLAVAAVEVVGNQVKFGSQDSLAGNSFFWSNNNWGGERYYNADVVEWLKDDWDTTIVRAAMGVDASGGYIHDPVANKNRVKAIVDAAIANDMYVIIDWHSHHAEDYQTEAISFFTEMANTYGQYENVIYEIYNEPLQISWSNTIKPYAENVIQAIRAVDPDNLIVVGTSTWSQDVDVAAADPITGHDNIAYALHFYAGTHGQSLRNKAQAALNSGVALMVTEWGTVNANGDGAPDVASTNAWMNFLHQNKITHLNWAMNDKNEGASALTPGASTSGGWSDNQLTTSGSMVRDIVRSYGGNVDTDGNGGGTDPGGGGDPGGPATGVVSHVVYDDGLGSNWNNWSWDTSAWVASPNPVYSGSNAISVTHNSAWGGLYLRADSPVSMAANEEIRFRIHGGNGGQTINFKTVAADDTVVQEMTLTPTAGVWTTVVIDYPDSTAPGSIVGMMFQDGSGGPQGTFHVDQIEIGDFADDGDAPVTGDFDDNGVLDINDLDLLTTDAYAFSNGNGNPAVYDMNGDGSVNLSDVTAWLAAAGAARSDTGNPFLPADANLDGVVDVSDLNLWSANKFTAVPHWSKGDFNADGVIDVSDLNLWSSHKFMTAGQLVAGRNAGSTASLVAASARPIVENLDAVFSQRHDGDDDSSDGWNPVDRVFAKAAKR